MSQVFERISLVGDKTEKVTGDLVFEHDLDFVVAVDGAVKAYPKATWRRASLFEGLFDGMFARRSPWSAS